MRTPGILIFGLVFSPCGLILDLTSTVAPNWRTLQGMSNMPSDTVYNQGVWDMCQSYTDSSSITCNLKSTDLLYFNNNTVIPAAQGMMVASLLVTLLGLAVVSIGARCWTNKTPRWTIAGIGGLLIFLSGVLTIIPIAWYTYFLKTLNSSITYSNPQSPDINVGYCIVLGYIGGIMEMLGGVVIFVGIFRCCGGRNRGEKPQVVHHHRNTTRPTDPTPYPHPRSNWNVPPSRASSSGSYSNNSRSDDFDYPRAKAPNKGVVNPAYNGRPYDADL